MPVKRRFEDYPLLKGFVGFESIANLQSNKCSAVPKQPGIYTVIRTTRRATFFLSRSVGGHFGKSDPTVSVRLLRQSWVPKAQILYLGKAGGGGSTMTLRKRLQKYMKFGLGEPVDHWGGRYIWQLADAASSVVCWKIVANPRQAESRLIRRFRAIYGQRPFANLRD